MDWKRCGKDWNRRRSAALRSTLGHVWPPRCLQQEGNTSRAIYLDLGSRNPEPEDRNVSGTRSSLQVFATNYPDAWAFRAVAFEADPLWAPMYGSLESIRQRFNFQSLDFHSVAVGTVDAMVDFSPSSGANAQVRPAKAGSNGARQVRSIDFASWLARHVRLRDFVVVKMDIEGMEFSLLPDLIARGVAPLIDELFLECHHAESFGNGPYTYADCIALHRHVYDAGVWVHDWD